MSFLFILCAGLLASCALANQDAAPSSPKPQPLPQGSHFTEQFDANYLSRWVKSEAKKKGAAEDVAHYNGEWALVDAEEDASLSMKVAHRHYGLSSPLKKPFEFNNNEPLVLQYEVKFREQMACGGSYIKLLEQKEGLALNQVAEDTSYVILFGPDKCGPETNVRFIYRVQHPTTGHYREVHLGPIPNLLTLLYVDKRWHLLTLIIRPDDSFEVQIDGVQRSSGSLSSPDLFSPSLIPPESIPDPLAVKPDSWVDNAKMDDPSDSKPADWDESQPQSIPDEKATKPSDWDEDAPLTLPDPNAEKPADWDDEEDGEWEPNQVDNPACSHGCGPWNPPLIPNPLYKGKWRPRQIDNPAYKGPWEAPLISNPEFHPYTRAYDLFKPIAAVAFELWTTTYGVHFDNILITNNETEALAFAQATWGPKKKAYEAEDLAKNKGFFRTIEEVIMGLVERAQENPLFGVLYLILIGVPLFFLFRGGNSEQAQRVIQGAVIRRRAEREGSAGVDEDNGEVEDGEVEDDEVEEDEGEGNDEGDTEEVVQEEQQEPEKVASKEASKGSDNNKKTGSKSKKTEAQSEEDLKKELREQEVQKLAEDEKYVTEMLMKNQKAKQLQNEKEKVKKVLDARKMEEEKHLAAVKHVQQKLEREASYAEEEKKEKEVALQAEADRLLKERTDAEVQKQIQEAQKQAALEAKARDDLAADIARQKQEKLQKEKEEKARLQKEKEQKEKDEKAKQQREKERLAADIERQKKEKEEQARLEQQRLDEERAAAALLLEAQQKQQQQQQEEIEEEPVVTPKKPKKNRATTD